jgi:TPR repeat protein
MNRKIYLFFLIFFNFFEAFGTFYEFDENKKDSKFFVNLPQEIKSYIVYDKVYDVRDIHSFMLVNRSNYVFINNTLKNIFDSDLQFENSELKKHLCLLTKTPLSHYSIIKKNIVLSKKLALAPNFRSLNIHDLIKECIDYFKFISMNLNSQENSSYSKTNEVCSEFSKPLFHKINSFITSKKNNPLSIDQYCYYKIKLKYFHHKSLNILTDDDNENITIYNELKQLLSSSIHKKIHIFLWKYFRHNLEIYDVHLIYDIIKMLEENKKTTFNLAKTLDDKFIRLPSSTQGEIRNKIKPKKENIYTLINYIERDKAKQQSELYYSFSYYTKLSDQDYAPAQYKLAKQYLRGDADGSQDEEKAFLLLQKASKNNYSKAQVLLGLLYYLGFYIPKEQELDNSAEALRWWSKAASANDKNGNFFMGVFYELKTAQLQGTSHNTDQEIEYYKYWYNRAKFFENLDGLIKSNQLDTTNKFQKQENHYNDFFIGLKDTYAIDITIWQMILGFMYETGKGVEKSLNNSVKYYVKAIPAHNPFSLKFLARVLSQASINLLDLSKKQLSLKELQLLAEGLKNNDSITKLDLRNNNLGSDGIKYLVEILKNNEKITNINLGDNSIGDEGLYSLLDLLNFPTNIKILELWSNDLTDKYISLFLENIRVYNSQIKNLDFNDNKITDNGALCFLNILKNNDAKLNFLNLKKNLIKDNTLLDEMEKIITHNRENYDREEKPIIIEPQIIARYDNCNYRPRSGSLEINQSGTQILHEFLNKNQLLSLSKKINNEEYNTVTKLSLSKCNLSGNEIEPLITALKDNKTIDYLEIGENEIDDSAINFIIDLLKENKTIDVLNLRNNKIGDEGCIALFRTILECHDLDRLSLGGNNITAASSPIIAKCLENNRVNGLFLWKNNIKSGASLIGDSLKHNTTLEELNLGWNSITSKDIHAISKNFKGSKLILRNNDLGDQGVKIICDNLFLNGKIETLELHKCNISDIGGRLLFNVFKNTPYLKELILDMNDIEKDLLNQISTINSERKKK